MVTAMLTIGTPLMVMDDEWPKGKTGWGGAEELIIVCGKCKSHSDTYQYRTATRFNAFNKLI